MQIFSGWFFQSFQNKHKQCIFSKVSSCLFASFLLQMSRFKGEATFSFATMFDATISVKKTPICEMGKLFDQPIKKYNLMSLNVKALAGRYHSSYFRGTKFYGFKILYLFFLRLFKVATPLFSFPSGRGRGREERRTKTFVSLRTNQRFYSLEMATIPNLFANCF